MEITSPEKDNPSPTTSPNSNASCTTTTTSGPPLNLIPTPNPTVPSPKPISRSHEPSPYPTTFVQADTSTFKQVVQMLTGSSDTAKQPSKTDPARGGGGGSSSIPPIKSTGQKKQGFKLYERRNSLKNGLMINTLIPGFSHTSGFSPRRNPEILSPSILDFPSLVLSPVTPLNEDSLRTAPSPSTEEEKAIAEKKFYFHPSPRTTPRDAEPQLLPLFPTTSPRVSGSSS
ncbi:VQ motif-containing protein 4 [Sesamum alatum]|uniref:VQ motif-containing protein 4 n=1 Tax=Sesamum alatum TaxID=300844 RepID=A0AAE1XYB5_9LAMI|nr:VQ motif-containing protein 4 [Sesamum alatum]